ncbi:NADPH oxidase family protein [Aspergillus melleus]|uniref:NADPH oxidase family protein n=1 Tax=Aspergillus melleus TaxID=138277 RepID=UPI001E8CB00D|nr:uncharacterized protein LDX57_008660 [Aspergillus melleus]KAH8430999.1 hypothetical protein LDX57_008660 [Aspergillus melleus]
MSWSDVRRGSMELLVQPRGGLTAELSRYASMVVDKSVVFPVLFSGPHGTSKPVDRFGGILIVVSGFGVASAIPYSKKIICGHLTCTSQVRRLHLVWQVDMIDEIKIAEESLNNILKDDIMEKGYILAISIYVKTGFGHNQLPFGNNNRVCLYTGIPEPQAIVLGEMSAVWMTRSSNQRVAKGQLLVMVAAADRLRDSVRDAVRRHVHQGVRFAELNYQPTGDDQGTV